MTTVFILYFQEKKEEKKNLSTNDFSVIELNIQRYTFFSISTNSAFVFVLFLPVSFVLLVFNVA